MLFFCRQLECQGQEEEHHWNWPSETPEGCLPQIQVRFSNDVHSITSNQEILLVDVSCNVKTCLDSDTNRWFFLHDVKNLAQLCWV